MLNIPGTITLIRTPTDWRPKFTGEIAAHIVGLFRVDTLATVFLASAKAADVQKEMRRHWPKGHNTVGAAQ